MLLNSSNLILRKASIKNRPPSKTDPSVDPVHMKLALEQSRKDLTEAQKQITKMKIEYAEVVPKQMHDKLVQGHLVQF